MMSDVSPSAEARISDKQPRKRRRVQPQGGEDVVAGDIALAASEIKRPNRRLSVAEKRNVISLYKYFERERATLTQLHNEEDGSSRYLLPPDINFVRKRTSEALGYSQRTISNVLEAFRASGEELPSGKSNYTFINRKRSKLENLGVDTLVRKFLQKHHRKQLQLRKTTGKKYEKATVKKVMEYLREQVPEKADQMSRMTIRRFIDSETEARKARRRDSASVPATKSKQKEKSNIERREDSTLDEHEDQDAILDQALSGFDYQELVQSFIGSMHHDHRYAEISNYHDATEQQVAELLADEIESGSPSSPSSTDFTFA